MRELNKQELLEISGGSISGAVIEALVKGITTIFELGRSLGTSLRRLTSKAMCKIGN